jgi:hypothetical protein
LAAGRIRIEFVKTKRSLPIVLLLLGLLWRQEAQAFYNPSTGRWLSRDPVGEAGGPNEHAFGENEPIASFDAEGRAIRRGEDGPPGPTPPYSKGDCDALRKFLDSQREIKPVFEKAVGTCKPPVFPFPTKRVADMSGLGCFTITDPGSRAVCFEHEQSHWRQMPRFLWDIIVHPCPKCEQFDRYLRNEINAYSAGIELGDWLYKTKCSGA